jgi:hypothetical protein
MGKNSFFFSTEQPISHIQIAKEYNLYSSLRDQGILEYVFCLHSFSQLDLICRVRDIRYPSEKPICRYEIKHHISRFVCDGVKVLCGGNEGLFVCSAE